MGSLPLLTSEVLVRGQVLSTNLAFKNFLLVLRQSKKAGLVEGLTCVLIYGNNFEPGVILDLTDSQLVFDTRILQHDVLLQVALCPTEKQFETSASRFEIESQCLIGQANKCGTHHYTMSNDGKVLHKLEGLLALLQNNQKGHPVSTKPDSEVCSAKS